MEYLKFDFKLSFFLTLTFILMTAAGTVMHEFGHYSVSKLLGYQASINYRSSTHWSVERNEYLENVYKNFSKEIKYNINFPGKDEYLNKITRFTSDDFWILLAGPLQTMVTGTIGLILLLIFRKKYITSDKVYIFGWVLIFIALFWLRQVANLFSTVLTFMSKGHVLGTGDEMRLTAYLDLNIWSIQIITGLVGIGILGIILRILPKPLILSFLISGLAGGLLGYYLWLVRFGKYIMP
jgi:hypothetical protein